MKQPRHPPGNGVWTLLQQHIDRTMWQQDDLDPGGRTFTRFVIVNPPEILTYASFDAAEEMFRALGDD